MIDLYKISHFELTEESEDLTCTIHFINGSFRKIRVYSSEFLNAGIHIDPENNLYVEDAYSNPIFNTDFEYCQHAVKQRMEKSFKATPQETVKVFARMV